MADPTNVLFIQELRLALQRLYDPAEMRRSPLLRVFGLMGKDDPAAALGSLLLEAIEALKPASSVPPQASAWRIYQALANRYAEQFTQREVAADLGLSIRQLRRYENEALRLLADYLVGRYKLQLQIRDLEATPRDGGEAAQGEDEAPSREQEIEWLKRSLSSEPTDVTEAVQDVLRTIRPLIQTLGVRVECTMPENLPRLAVQPTTMRQALLNILTAAVRSAPGGKVQVAAEVAGRQVCLLIQPTRGRPALVLQPDDVESLEMARQLVGLSSGALEVKPGERGKLPFSARLVLPTVEQVVVLVIDDNTDTLQLFERYLSGTRYRFTAAPDAQQALTLAEQLAPSAVLLDVMLPGIDGWEILGRLREHPKTRDVPLIVCTILPQEHLALTLGAAAFLRKPVSRRALLTTLDRLI